MLTGYDFDTTVTIDQWFSNAWNSDSANAFYSALSDLGYSMRLYTVAPKNLGLEYASGKISNVVDKEANGAVLDVHYDEMVSNCVRLACFRYVPHQFKRYFTVSSADFSGVVTSRAIGSEVVHDRHWYLENLRASGLSADDSCGKLLTVQHLRGTHAPYLVSENGTYQEDATMVETARGNFLMIKEYMDQLKALGLYDDATIIVTSDHGDKENNMQVVYLIKQPGESHKSTVTNAAPISHIDMIGTLLQAAGGNAASLGLTTIYDWSEDEERVRTVMHNAMDNNYPKVHKYGSTSTGTHTVMYLYTYEGDLK